MSDHIELKVPALGESVVEATVARWHKKEGAFVETDELLVELETDKVTLEVAAPQAGQLTSITAPQGAIVQVGHVLGRIQTDNVSDVSSEKNDTSDPTQQNISKKGEESFDPTSTVKLSATIHTDLSPAVRKMVVENRVDTYEIQGTGKSGRITKTDIVNHLDQERLETRVPISRLRSRIAERLKQAQNTAAILTTFNEADMSAINKLRQKYKESFEKKYGVKLGYVSFFIKASVRALQQLPIVNSRIQGNEIVTCNYIDMGVAVSASAGLVVPVVRDADLKSMAALELAVRDFGKKARENQLTIEEMSGGTFTISNGGVFGSLLSTPILNPPQSAILGMHKIQDRPVVIEGRIEVRPMMYLALSYDHRLIDGKEAVTFLVQIKESLENPESFLLEV